MLAYQRTLEKVISFLLLFASANVAVLIQKKEGGKKKEEGARENVALLCLLFFFLNDKRNKGKERENLTSTIFQIFSEEGSCARVRTTYSLTFFCFSGRGGGPQHRNEFGLAFFTCLICSICCTGDNFSFFVVALAFW